MRFKCVSKLWSCLIHFRYFSNRYYRYITVASPPQPPSLYMSLVDQLGVVSRESVLLSLSSSSSSTGAEYLFPDLILPEMGGLHMVSVRGLILYNAGGKSCIYNPTTGQLITLASVKTKISIKKALVDNLIRAYGLQLYTVEAGGSWKKFEFNGQAHRPASPGLCINGVIYYLGSTCMSRDILVSFDVRSEEFNVTQAPGDAVPAFYNPVGFIEYGGKPAIFDHTNLVPMGLVDLWVLEDGGKWSTKSMVLQPCQMRLFDKNSIPLHVHDTTQNGEVILAPFEFLSPYYILYYDVRKNDLRKVVIRGIPDHWYGKPDLNLLMCFKQLDQSESIIHFEV